MKTKETANKHFPHSQDLSFLLENVFLPSVPTMFFQSNGKERIYEQI
jgi:hypothetical protein